LLQDRRQYPRLVPASPLFVHVGECNGFLSNLSEGGLAVEGLFPEMPGEIFSLALDLPNSGFPMQVTAQTTWRSDSENRTGAHFVDLPANSRHQLREWICAQVAATVKERPPQAFGAATMDDGFNFAAICRQLTSGVDPTEPEEARSPGGLRRLIGFFLTVVTLCSALVFLGYYLGSRGDSRRAQMVAPAATTPDLPAQAQVESAEPPPPATNPSSSTVPLDVPGFVLQVAAMEHEANADGLSEKLQKNDFPAFVFKRTSDRFYKVAVGSFADAESAVVVKRKLEKRGFKAILRHWAPE
jgi:SPOR domain/PilZ domain